MRILGSQRSAAVAVSTLGTAGARLTGALGGVLSARLLGPEGKGQYALVVLAATVAGTIGSAGLEFWVAREVARGDGRLANGGPPGARLNGERLTGERAVAPDPVGGSVVRRVVGRHLVVAATVLAVVTAFALIVAVPVGWATVGEILAAGLLALATVVSMLLLAVPHGQLRMGVVAVATTAGGATYLVWTGVLLVVGTPSVSLAVLGAGAAAVVIAAVALLGSVPGLRPVMGPWRSDPITSFGHLDAARFGLPAMAGEVLTLLSSRLDVVLVAVLLDVRSAGLYVVALAFSELLLVLPDGVALVVLPSASQQLSTPGSSAPRRSIARLTRSSAVVMAAAAVAMMAVSGPAMRTVFGSSFVGAGRAVPAVLLATVAFGVWKILAAEVTALGRPGARAASSALGLVVMVAADSLLVPALGLAGAGLGSALGSIASVTHLARARRALLTREEPLGLLALVDPQ